MIYAYLVELLMKVPNPTRLLTAVWARLLLVGLIALAIWLLFAGIFPLLDVALGPSPNV